MSEVRRKLPVKVTDKLLVENPEFAKLLSSLNYKLTADGTSVHVKKKLQEAEESMKVSRVSWLEQHVLYQELLKMLTDRQMSAVTEQDIKYEDMIQSIVTAAEMEDYVECDPVPGGQRTLLGLTKEDLQRRDPNKKNKLAFQQQIIPELESRLRTKCERLVGYYDAAAMATSKHSSDRDSQLTFARASQLPSLLESAEMAYEKDLEELRDTKAQRQSLSNEYYNTLLHSLRTLEKLITRHRLKTQAETDKIETQWLASRCDAFCLKLRLFELQLLQDTYHSSAVKALTQIRNEVDQKIAETKSDLLKVSQALGAYESVGHEFDTLVKEYTQLKNEIENKQWALRELKQHEHQSGDG